MGGRIECDYHTVIDKIRSKEDGLRTDGAPCARTKHYGKKVTSPALPRACAKAAWRWLRRSESQTACAFWTSAAEMGRPRCRRRGSGPRCWASILLGPWSRLVTAALAKSV